MEDNSFSFDHKEKREQSVDAMPVINIESLEEAIELERVDYETLLEEIRVS